MSKVRTFFGSQRLVRFAVAGMTAASLAGCADSERFASDPLGNPFKTASDAPRMDRDGDMPYRRPVSTGSVSSQPLPPPVRTSALPPPNHYANYAVPAHESPRLAEAPAPSRAETSTASIGSGHGGWSPNGGMPVIAGQGETAKILADRYNVPTEALLRANGFTSAAQVRPGTRVVIPVYSASVASSGPRDAVQEKPRHDHAGREKLLAKHEPKPEHGERLHFVKGPDPVVRHEEVHGRAEAMKKMAHAEKVEARTASRAEPRKLEPAKRVPVAKVEPMKPEPARPAKVAKLEEPRKAPVIDATPTASLPPAAEAPKSAPAAAATSANGNPEFRWPARGRIIQGFKVGGNDGINIAVPEGTAVKAAEAGVVAYAGSEIKGFGNLVLIRHPNGYVTAYANNGELDVKRGEQVKRGQTIAKSGQSGNVASPQLHFELRKGSTPVDPTQYLAGL